MIYAIFEAATGRIAQVTNCDEGRAVIPPGMAAITVEAQIDPNAYYVYGGVPVEYPPKPSEFHVWSWVTYTWIDPRSLQDIKDQQWAIVKKARDAAEWAGFTWGSYVFDSDVLSQSRIQGAVLMANLAFTTGSSFVIDWTLADNSVVTLSAAQMLDVGMEMGMHISSVHTIGRALRNQIESATTIPAVLAIVWP